MKDAKRTSSETGSQEYIYEKNRRIIRDNEKEIFKQIRYKQFITEIEGKANTYRTTIYTTTA